MSQPSEGVAEFVRTQPSLESYWRAVILFGRNVASYKFALGRSLLELPDRSGDFVRLEELAEPFSKHICEHLRIAEKQGTSGQSRFLDACRMFNAGRIPKDALVATTARIGFANVIDAFHVVNQKEIPTRFFIDERKGASRGIRVTDELWKLRETVQASNLPIELEARWRLVETAWGLNLSAHVLKVECTPDGQDLFVQVDRSRRLGVTGARDALNGYQKGKCFYCALPIHISEADVDHFFPHVLKKRGSRINVDGIWNLVLACARCNRGTEGKSALVPDLVYLKRLYRRGERLIASHHPLRDTLIRQTGDSPRSRAEFLQRSWDEAKSLLIHAWVPAGKQEEAW